MSIIVPAYNEAAGIGPNRGLSHGHAADPVVRQGASAGGVVTALLISALEHGQKASLYRVDAEP